METIGSKRSYALTWCMSNNDDDDDDVFNVVPESWHFSCIFSVSLWFCPMEVCQLT